MRKLRIFFSAAIFCSGVILLCGCQHQSTLAGGVPIPPTHAAPPVQAQVQEIDSNSHIPPAEKAAIEARIAHGNGIVNDKTPANGH